MIAKDVSAYAMVVGVSARIVGWIGAYDDVLDFGAGDTVTHSQGHQYRKISDDEVRRVR